MSRQPHLTDTALSAALDPSSDAAERTAARAHAAECAACAVLLSTAERAERETANALRLLDHPMPAVDMVQIVARARVMGHTGVLVTNDEVRPSLPASSPRSAAGAPAVRRPVWWSAGVTVLGLAAAAAALAPQSPLRQLIARAFAPPPPAHTGPPHPIPVLPLSPRLGSAPRGVALTPQGLVVIQFRSGQSAGVIRIIPGQGPRVAVQASGDGPTYSVGRDTITVDNRAVETISYAIELPPDTPSLTVRVRVGGEVVYTRVGDHVRAVVTADTAGRYVIPLVRILR